MLCIWVRICTVKSLSNRFVQPGLKITEFGKNSTKSLGLDATKVLDKIQDDFKLSMWKGAWLKQIFWVVSTELRGKKNFVADTNS